MTAFDDINGAWSGVEARFLSSPPIRRLNDGTIGVPHYLSYLRETYFYTRENPQIQAVATAYFRGGARDLTKPFLKHAASEVGHDQMALNDIAALGGDPASIPMEQPLPGTIALTSFAYYAIQHRSPVSYLGYLSFLEFLPTSSGGRIAQALSRLGVPRAAMTFLAEHQEADIGHNNLMKLYVDRLVRSPSDVEDVVYAMGVTGRLFQSMVECAFEAADERAGGHGLVAERAA